MEDLDEYIFDEEGNPVMMEMNSYRRIEQLFADEEDSKDIFHVKGDGYDVTLSLSKGCIVWKNVNPAGKKKGIFKGKSKHEDRCTVMLKDVFAVQMKRKKVQASEEGVCIGFNMHICERMGPNVKYERIVLFEHPSEALCSMYIRKINMFMQEMPGRPKSIKLFLQCHAGARTASSVYKNKILPMFQAADVNVDCVEVQHNEHIKQEMVHMNLDDFDCVVAMGGDGTANKVMDGLMTSSQKYQNLDLKPGFTPVRARMPLGIIPVGSTNEIVRSVIGCEDPVTAALHIIMGNKAPVDVCSMYMEEKFQQWCFNCQYGFAGNVLTFRKRYTSLGKRGLEPAFIKALTKSKLRSYKCDIEYIPSECPTPRSMKFLPCAIGCDVCWDEHNPDENEVTQDMVQAFDPLAESHDSDTLVDLAAHEDTPWKSVKGEYLHIGLYAISGRSEMAPRGMSKYTHLNNGILDLVLMKQTPRKEFVRMLKRLGNSKNQFDFPFVETIQATQVRFRIRLPTGFKYRDTKFSEIDYEIERRKNQVSSVTKSVEILEIGSLSDSDNEDSSSTPVKTVQSKPSSAEKQRPPMNRSQSAQQILKKDLRRTNTETSISVDDLDSDEDDDDYDDSENEDQESQEIVHVENGVRTVRSVSAASQNLVGPAYRMTFAEQDRAKRRKREQKKEDKKKTKEEQKMKSVWNVDCEIVKADTLDVKIHHGLLKICGLGISPDTVYPETTLLCIPRL